MSPMVPQRSGPHVFISGAVGLAGVFDDGRACVLRAGFEDGVHVGRLAVKVDGD